MKDFRDLKVWHKAHELTLAVYKATGGFPREELYGLTSQIRRCSVSIADNIAEGCGKRGGAEFNRYLLMASGSASELDYHLLLARDLKYLNSAEYESLTNLLGQLRRMLTALVRKIDMERLEAKC
ncbi:MAG: four helix bundle protein [Terriglobales bacterium]